MDFLRTKGGFVVNRPGNVLFIPVKSDGTLDYANAIRNTALINTITVTNSRTTTDIPNGNSLYPGGSRVTNIAGTIAIEFSTIDPVIWAMASGSTMESIESGKLLKIYEYDKIKEDNTLVLDGEYKENEYINVIGSDGTVFEKVSNTTPEAGEYSVKSDTSKKTTTLTFNEADANKNVSVTMFIKSAIQSYTQGRKSMKNHKIIITSDYSTLNDSDDLVINIEISQASLTSEMVDALQKDPSSLKTLTFNMYEPLPGEQPYKISYENKKVGE